MRLADDNVKADPPVLNENDLEGDQRESSPGYSNNGLSPISYIPPSIDTTIRRPPVLRSLYHLVLVPCHGVWVGNEAEDVYDMNKWVLEQFDRDGEENRKEEDEARVRAFVEHVKKG
jgi:hypothetical protein